jgi:hypothetical protein
LLQKIDTWFVSCVLTVVSSIRNTFGESINFDTCTREVGAKDCINNGCFSQFSDKYWPLYPYLSKVSTNLSSNFFPPAHFTCQENKVLTEHHKLKSWPSITTTKKVRFVKTKVNYFWGKWISYCVVVTRHGPKKGNVQEMFFQDKQIRT